MKEITCCFTGHRPEKLNISEAQAKQLLKSAIEQAIADGFTRFITGMARGIDIWAAEIILSERIYNSEIRLICACPYMGFEKSRSYDERLRYARILSSSDSIEYISKSYSMFCYQKRNMWMVDQSGRVIAAYAGIKSGTKNTVIYAENHGVPVYNIL